MKRREQGKITQERGKRKNNKETRKRQEKRMEVKVNFEIFEFM